MQPEIEKPGKRYLGNVPTSSDFKFHELLSTNVGDIREKTIFHIRPPFSATQPVTEKQGKRYHKKIFYMKPPFFRDAACF